MMYLMDIMQQYLHMDKQEVEKPIQFLAILKIKFLMELFLIQ